MTSAAPLSATAAQSRAGLWRIVMSGLLVGLIVLAGTLGLVGYAAQSIDRVQAQREVRQVARSVDRTLVRMRESVTSSAVWDEAYKTMTPTVTAVWADPNFGSYYADFMKQEVTVAFEGNGRYAYASRKSETVPLASEAAFAKAVAPLYEAVRAESARKRFGPGGVRNVSFQAVATREALVSVNGEIYLVAASSIVPDTRGAAVFDAPDTIVVSGRPLKDFMKALTDDLDIAAPRFTPVDADAEGPAVLLRGPRGEALGQLRWSPARPGLELLSRAQPVIWSVVAFLVAAGILLLVRVQIMLRRMDRNERELTTARDAANAASEAKSQFLANMSHELRTPLNGIVAVSDVLRGRLTSAEDREMVGLIAASSGVLEQVVNDILDTAKIEAGQLTLEATAFEIEPCIRRIAHLHAASAAAKDLDLSWSVSERAAGTYLGDPVRFTQVLSNLLSNAVKFTTEGAVRITVRTGPRGLRIAVRDSGIGFDAETSARLFRRFEQADVSMTRRYGGTGLGLSISAALIEAMGGRLEARSTPGKGAVFVVTLPLERVAQARPAVQTTPAEPDSTERALRVLLAEDHPTNQRVVALILEPLGVDLTIVPNGAEAVRATEAQAFDVILMDVQMPVMDGLTATRLIRAREAAEGRLHTPIVSLTAHALGDHVAASLASGADRHMAKPIRPDVLIGVVVELTQPPERAGDVRAA